MTRSFHRVQHQQRHGAKALAEAFALWLGQDRRTAFDGDSEADAIEAAFVDCMLSGFAGDLESFKRLLAREGYKPSRHVRRWRLFIPNRVQAGAAE